MTRATRVSHARLTRTQAAKIAVRARLKTESWDDMTGDANKSSRHVKNLDRWRAEARAVNPSLSDDQADRLAEMLRSDYFTELARKSAAVRNARRAAREDVPDERVA